MAEPPPDAKRARLDEEGDGGEDADADAGAQQLELLESDGLGAGAGEDGGDEPDAEALGEADQCQINLEQINEEASDRVLAVEQEYNARRRPLYVARSSALLKVPRFWKKVLTVHPVVRNLVTEADMDVLDYLTDVDVEDFEDIKSGFRVKFMFDENPFFTNRELVKELHYAEDAALTVRGTDINWLPGKEPADEAAYMQQTDAALGAKRPPPPPPANLYGLFAEWFRDQLEGVFGGHDDLADVLKDDIWPDPLRWYRDAQSAGGLLYGSGEAGEGDEFEAAEFEEEFIMEGEEPGAEGEEGGAYGDEGEAEGAGDTAEDEGEQQPGEDEGGD